MIVDIMQQISAQQLLATLQVVGASVGDNGERWEEAIFYIQDEGIDIPTADQAQLFNSFHRASNVGTISGTGLGLAIVKKSVDLHSGKIAVTSEVGVGTKFTVTFPLNHWRPAVWVNTNCLYPYTTSEE